MSKLFHYKGRNQNGHTISGDLSVSSVDEVVSYLEKRDIVPIHIKPINKSAINISKLLSLNLGKNKVDIYDLMNFCRQLAALNGAGIPLIKAINQLSQSSNSRFLGETLSTIADDISAGLNLGSALKKHPDAFSPIAVNIITLGENTGHLNEALLQLGNYLESTMANRRRLLSAIRYPSFVIIATMLAMIIMNFFVIPKFITIFSNFRIELPLATRIIIKSSNFMTNNWPILLTVIICLFFAGFRLLKIPSIRYVWDKHKLSLPIIGDLQKRIILSQFTWTFSLILRSGVPIIQGITLASDSTENSYFSKQLLMIGDAIDHGENFSRAATISGLFTPTTIQMIEVGEESGRLDELLAEIAKYYDVEIDYDLRRLDELIEPILLTIIGAMVLILALGIYLPMWDLVQAIKQ
jgi:MSHA biogenesis protein MshG